MGVLIIPPDKSISHRAIILASISEGKTLIKNCLLADDCLRTIEAFRGMGVRIDGVAYFSARTMERGARLRSLRYSTDIVVHGRELLS